MLQQVSPTSAPELMSQCTSRIPPIESLSCGIKSAEAVRLESRLEPSTLDGLPQSKVMSRICPALSHSLGLARFATIA
jgi:hypothetical protein